MTGWRYVDLMYHSCVSVTCPSFADNPISTPVILCSVREGVGRTAEYRNGLCYALRVTAGWWVMISVQATVSQWYADLVQKTAPMDGGSVMAGMR